MKELFLNHFVTSLYNVSVAIIAIPSEKSCSLTKQEEINILVVMPGQTGIIIPIRNGVSKG